MMKNVKHAKVQLSRNSPSILPFAVVCECELTIDFLAIVVIWLPENVPSKANVMLITHENRFLFRVHTIDSIILFHFRVDFL